MVLYAAEGLTEKRQAYDLLAQGVKEYWNISPLPELERQEGGKPRFADLEGLQFNLSHSGSWALCALDDHPVGVDIQEIKTWKPGLIDRVCSEAEKLWLSRQRDADLGFGLLWALKESRVKYEGRGIVGTGEMIRAIRVPLPEQIGECLELEGLWFRTYCGDSWAAAACGQSAPPEEFIWRDC